MKHKTFILVIFTICVCIIGGSLYGLYTEAKKDAYNDGLHKGVEIMANAIDRKLRYGEDMDGHYINYQIDSPTNCY